MTDAGHMSGGAPILPDPVLDRREDNEAECRRWGHDFEFVVNGEGRLLRVDCGRCGARWAVTEL